MRDAEPSIDPSQRGREAYAKGYSFEDRVAEAYRLLGYRVESGQLFDGRQVDLFLELNLGDLRIRRAVECKAGDVTVDDLDRFLLKLARVRQRYPDASGTVVAGLSFTDSVRTHGTAAGLQLTLYRDLSTQILDGPSYAQALLREIHSNDRYVPDLFIEPTIVQEHSEPRAAFELIDEWLKDSRWNQLTLLGDVGTGKSFLSRMIALRLANEYLARPSECPCPILIDLRNADREFSLEGLVLTHFATHGLNRATFAVFDFLLAEGRIVLILDGFDEMASKVAPTITTRNFHELSRGVKRNAKVLLTCRTHYFKSRTEEEEVVLGGSRPQASDVAKELYFDLISRKGFRIAYVRPFSLFQVERYVRRACPKTFASVLEKIHKIYNLAELSQRPMLLEMIVKSVDKLTENDVNPAQLYQVFTDAWIHRDRWRDVISPEEKLKFLMVLTRSLWEQETASIHYAQLEDYVGIQLAGLIDKPQRLVEIDGEIRTASFLVRDDAGRYGFAHTSYAEYFLARYLAGEISTRGPTCLSVRRLHSESIDFLLHMVDTAECEKVLASTLQQPYQPLISENALLILYRLRRNLLIEEKARASDADELEIDMPSGVHLEGAKLAQVNLEGAVLHYAGLEGADLHECILTGADITYSVLRHASAGKIDARGAILRNVDASHAALSEANLHLADLKDSSFIQADLTNAIVTAKNLDSAAFSGAVLHGAIFPSDEPGWAHDQALQELLRSAERYARINYGADGDDLVSDAILSMLSRPEQSARLRGMTRADLRVLASELVWRAASRRSLLEGSAKRVDLASVRRVDLADVELWVFDDPGSKIQFGRVLDALREVLSERSYRILVARYVDEDSVKEIAQREGLTHLQATRQLDRARALARETLTSRGLR